MSSLGEMFATFRSDAWRCEARDSYAMTDHERFALWRRGAPLPRKTSENNEWIATIEAASARGARISRARLVGHPITEYTRFEFAVYPDNIASGETIEIVDRWLLDQSWEAAPDFWIFDDEVVFVQHYDEDGGFVGAEQAPDPAPYRELRARLLIVAVPFAGYELTDVPKQRVGPPGAPLPSGLLAVGH